NVSPSDLSTTLNRRISRYWEIAQESIILRPIGCRVGLLDADPKPFRGRFRVPAVYLTSANVLFFAFFTFNEINKLRVFSQAQNSGSLHRHFLLGTQGDNWIDGGRTAGRQ